jgi:hypothetical protein
VTIKSLRIVNPGWTLSADLRIWLSAPGFADITLIEAAGTGALQLPSGLDADLGPITLFTAGQSFPYRGLWLLRSQLKDTMTGDLFTDGAAPFVIR